MKLITQGRDVRSRDPSPFMNVRNGEIRGTYQRSAKMRVTHPRGENKRCTVKRFAIATVLAVVLGLAAAGTADAQYVIQYNRVTPNGGVVTTSQLYNLGTVPIVQQRSNAAVQCA